MNDMDWDRLTTESEKHLEEIRYWIDTTKENSRLNIYREIDQLPISSLMKMHIVFNVALDVATGIRRKYADKM